MKSIKNISLASLTFLALWNVSSAFAQIEVCKDVLEGGVFNQYQLQRSIYARHVLAAQLTRMDSGEAKRKMKGLGGIKIPGLPPLSGEFSDDAFRKWQRAVRQTIDVDQILQYQESIMRSVASRDLLSTWESCIVQTSKGGLYAYLKRFGSVTAFQLKWRRYPQLKQDPQITSFTVHGADIADNEKHLVEIGETIPDNNEITITLHTHSKDGAVFVNMNTTIDGTSAFLPERVELPEFDTSGDPPPKILTIASCVGKGGMQGIRFWGPEGEVCNGTPSDWGRYDQQSRDNPEICKCTGKGGLNGVGLWGPKGELCGGQSQWGTYSDSCVALAESELCSCVGRGNIIGSHMIWGPKGEACGGIPGWGTYTSSCHEPK